MDAFVTGKLSEKAPATGLGGIVQNIPIVKAFSRLDKYNNVAETRAGISLALAANQITPEEADVLTGKVDSYIEMLLVYLQEKMASLIKMNGINL